MGLSTRLTLAMIGLVVMTAGAVGLVTFHAVESAILPRALVAGAVVVVCAVALAVLITRSMTRPLLELTRAVEAFARGDSAEIASVPVGAGEEIGVLGRAIERMAAVAGEKTEAARHSAELLEITVASMADGVLVLDPCGRILFANPACRTMLGDRLDIGSPEWQRDYHRFEPDGTTPFPLAKSPINRAMRGESFDNVELIVRRVGETSSIHIVASGRVLRNQYGDYAGAVIVYRDVTELTEKAAEIRRNADIFGSIMASMADAVLLVNEHAKVVFANRAAHDLMGTHATSGMNDWSEHYEVFAADATTPLELVDWPLARAVRGEHVDNFEIAIRATGTDRLTHLVVGARPIRGEGNAPKGAVVVFRDVSELKETERLLRQSQKMDAIGQLTGGVAHDFNNILTVITGTIEILADGVADRPKLAAITKLIDEAATRGSALTQQLLAFARRQALQPRRTDINLMVLETARLLRPTLGEQIEIRALLGADVCHAIVDPSQLSTALLNLAVNARDAMPRGGKLTLETSNFVIDAAYARSNPEVNPGPYVMIAVSDTGTGIAPEIRDKVFEPFFTTKETGKGTGLGLSMVYGFVKQSNGHVKLYSEEGQGTTVKLFLPRCDDCGKTDAEAESSAPAVGRGEAILVVEDDEMVRRHVIAQLESLGYATLSASTGAEALAIVDRGTPFELLFTDIVMPGGMNGRQLADEVARRRPGIRILFTSGYTETAIVHDGRLDAGIAVLNKPYRKAELARKIRACLDGQETE